MTTLRALVILCVLAATSSCAAPLQNGGVVMSPGAAARLDLMCRYRGDSGNVCAVEAE